MEEFFSKKKIWLFYKIGINQKTSTILDTTDLSIWKDLILFSPSDTFFDVVCPSLSLLSLDTNLLADEERIVGLEKIPNLEVQGEKFDNF